MYRVVLIDDENRIVEGLRRVVRWADYRCQVVGTAGDGAEGSRLIRELKPHIVFTDIRMPGQDGLAMIAGLRSEFPDMQVAILTAYRDFAFAQEAIRLGVARFLLKPSKMDEIKEALQTMVERLDKDAAESGEKDEEDEQANTAGSFLVNQALDYMEKNYQQKLTLQSVADCCYVSQWHLSKLLNRYTEKSFYDTLNAIRIDRAKMLLADPKLKIGEIGEMVGYADTAHFARTFKKLVGMSANEYRNSLK
ncbi:MAG: response regulator [Oscillibacter sp.]|nr:response regulator [Oscillibacter sp.]MBD5169029.1 response regulator [Oscillibacter sp.]